MAYHMQAEGGGVPDSAMQGMVSPVLLLFVKYYDPALNACGVSKFSPRSEILTKCSQKFSSFASTN